MRWYEHRAKKMQKNNFSFDKYIFLIMNRAIDSKTMENGRKHRDIKIVKSYERRNYLVSEPTYHTVHFSSENLLARGLYR